MLRERAILLEEMQHRVANQTGRSSPACASKARKVTSEDPASTCATPTTGCGGCAAVQKYPTRK